MLKFLKFTEKIRMLVFVGIAGLGFGAPLACLFSTSLVRNKETCSIVCTDKDTEKTFSPPGDHMKSKLEFWDF